MLSILILILAIIFTSVVSSFIPIGTENSTVRRLPVITFAIMALNVLVYYGTLPAVAGQLKEIIDSGTQLEQFVMQHQEQLLADKDVRKELIGIGLISKSQSDFIEEQMKRDPDAARDYEFWFKGSGGAEMRDEFSQKVAAFKAARNKSLRFNYGLAPNGEWHAHQLITYAFLHADVLHLFGNLIVFFAIAFTLEDLWGRGVFGVFYIFGAIFSCLPFVFSPSPAPLIGASGAISATMGAFLIRLPKTKIKLFFWSHWFIRMFLGKKKLIVFAPGYVYLIAYFLMNIIQWYFDRSSPVAYSVHIAGFVYGAGFAFILKASRYEETHINPKIEAKVSFQAPEAVTQGLEFLDKGKVELAERKLRSHLIKDPNNLETILALIQVYQQTMNYDQLNSMYGRLIRYHLANDDKEAALFAYDNLLSSFPDNDMAARIPVRDWMVICEYLREAEMNREAGVEYERLVNACPDDPNAVRAAVQGGEAALLAQDIDRSYRLFKMAESMSPPAALAGKVRTGIERCEKILSVRPQWAKKQAQAPAAAKNLAGQKPAM
jgi:membrane associated rhomboid family serine protease